MRDLAMYGFLAALFVWPANGRAEEWLTLAFGNDTSRFTGAELLARPDVATVQTPHDESYGRSMTYRAVPLLACCRPTL